jgi:hypothetical protein
MKRNIKNSKPTYLKTANVPTNYCMHFISGLKKQKAQNGGNCTKITLVCIGFTSSLKCTMRCCVWNILEQNLSTHYQKNVVMQPLYSVINL